MAFDIYTKLEKKSVSIRGATVHLTLIVHILFFYHINYS